MQEIYTLEEAIQEYIELTTEFNQELDASYAKMHKYSEAIKYAKENGKHKSIVERLKKIHKDSTGEVVEKAGKHAATLIKVGERTKLQATDVVKPQDKITRVTVDFVLQVHDDKLDNKGHQMAILASKYMQEFMVAYQEVNDIIEQKETGFSK